jgi:hypothetical protein
MRSRGKTGSINRLTLASTNPALLESEGFLILLAIKKPGSILSRALNKISSGLYKVFVRVPENVGAAVYLSIE